MSGLQSCPPCNRWIRQSNAIPILFPPTATSRARTIFFFDLDPTPDRILLAEAAVKAALRLRPDSAEAHFAMADFLFRCRRDYDGALKELAISRPGLPNDTAFFILSGYINRRRNNWSQAERGFSTAVALDPRNPNAYNLLADTYN